MIDSTATVCVIGAGIAGLVTAKTLAQDGFDVLLIERDSDLGGTWAPSRTYPGLRTNNSKQTYEFSDFPYPDSTDTFPYAEDVRGYLESYADNFDIRSSIRFNQEVCNVSRASDDSDRWTVTFRSTDSANEETKRDFDFMVVCTGVFHIPRIPAIEGMEEFGGRILHSSVVSESTYRPGEKLIVVGGGKSAFDCAAWAARNGNSPTLLYRRPQWMVPRFLPGGRIPGDWLLISRFMANFLRYYHSSGINRFMHSVGKPLVRLWWGLFAFAWPKDLKMPPTLKPRERLPAGLEKAGAGDDFYTVLNDGSADAICGSIKRFTKDGIELEQGEELSADIVIFATGWQQNLSFLSEELRKKISAAGYPRLYRHILPPAVANIGFIGYASSFSCTLTAEIGSHWLSEHFLGKLKLPSVDKMNEEIDLAHSWANDKLPNRGTEGFIGPYICNYVDDLIVDMGLNTKRTGSVFREYLTVFRASRFAGIADERRRLRDVVAP
jgi:cation diffusion facilitator CzcD-associated flavoprotein CzcO